MKSQELSFAHIPGKRSNLKGLVLHVNVCCDGVEYSLPLLVVGGKGPALLGRNWLEKIKLNWAIIKQLSSHNKRLEEILQKHAQLFEEGLGTLQGTKAKIHVDPTATPIFHKACSEGEN